MPKQILYYDSLDYSMDIAMVLLLQYSNNNRRKNHHFEFDSFCILLYPVLNIYELLKSIFLHTNIYFKLHTIHYDDGHCGLKALCCGSVRELAVILLFPLFCASAL